MSACIRIQVTAEQRALMNESDAIAKRIPKLRGRTRNQGIYLMLERARRSLDLFEDPRRFK